MGKTDIQYAQRGWNPMVGCSKELPCFARCYARRLAKRFAANPQFSDEYRERYRKAFTVGPQLFPERLDEPLRWRKPLVVFVCSQGDLFHDDVPFEFVEKVFDNMFVDTGFIGSSQQHEYIILTKRPERMAAYIKRDRNLRGTYAWDGPGQNPAANHIWLGVSVEDQDAVARIDVVRNIPAAHRWISFEPLIGDPGPINYDGIHGVVVGGESGSGARPMHPDWPRKIRDDCKAAGVPFFFKQWGEWADLTCDEESKRLMQYSRSDYIFTANGELLGAGSKSAPGGLVDPDWEEKGGAWMGRVGKKKAGNVLDGEKWDQTPWGVK